MLHLRPIYKARLQFLTNKNKLNFRVAFSTSSVYIVNP